VSTDREKLTQYLRPLLQHHLSYTEIQNKAAVACEINRLKKKKNALILGHNYMEIAIFHSVADITGDSLQLCREASKTNKDMIVFCGVQFMAETAKILNPTKKVLIPSDKAGCSLASSLSAKDIRELRKRYPEAPVLSYINTYAEVKAESDFCCTSSNAVKIVNSLSSKHIIFLPDEYLARNVAKETGRVIRLSSDKAPLPELPSLIVWKGKCEVHEQFTVEDIQQARHQFPNLCVVAHPECSPEVVAISDYSGSTTQLIKYVQSSPLKQFLILTECAMGDNIIAKNPDKEILRLCLVRCPHMEQITLEQVLHCLETESFPVELEESLRIKAKQSIDNMLRFS